MDLESKLTYDNQAPPDQQVNGGSGESGDVRLKPPQSPQKDSSGTLNNLARYKQNLLSGMSNVVFGDEYPGVD